MSCADLSFWLKRNRPDLGNALLCITNDDQRIVLNKATGLNVLSSDMIEESSERFLAALIRISKETPPGAVDNRVPKVAP